MANPPPLYKFHLLLFIIFLQYLLCLHYLTSCFRRYILHDHFITQTMPAPASNYSLGSSFTSSLGSSFTSSLGSSFTPGIHLIRFPCHIFYLSTQNSPFPISLFSISIIYPCQKKAKVFHSRIFLLLLLLFLPRACLKNHSRDLHSPLCGEFIPNLVNIARYDS